MSEQRPMWTLVRGYPLTVAIKQEQVLADTLQQVRYITDQQGVVHVVTPNPNSAQRNPNYRSPNP